MAATHIHSRHVGAHRQQSCSWHPTFYICWFSIAGTVLPAAKGSGRGQTRHEKSVKSRGKGTWKWKAYVGTTVKVLLATKLYRPMLSAIRIPTASLPAAATLCSWTRHFTHDCPSPTRSAKRGEYGTPPGRQSYPGRGSSIKERSINTTLRWWWWWCFLDNGGRHIHCLLPLTVTLPTREPESRGDPDEHGQRDEVI